MPSISRGAPQDTRQPLPGQGVVIIGAGPGGLVAGYRLAQQGVPVTVLEADPAYVGGISRTARYSSPFGEFCFDIGGHRFFSKSKEVEDFWSEILPNEMIERPRSSRIYYRKRFFSYPLKPLEALRKLGPLEAARCVASYAQSRLFPIAAPRSFQDWVSNQFGERLFRIFFKTYTEKVWGMRCSEISADWAAQRIQGLSLTRALLDPLKPKAKQRGAMVKTLIDSFRYPRRGPGMLWEACARKICEAGGEVRLGHRVTGCRLESAGHWVVNYQCQDGSCGEISAAQVVSTAPLGELVQHLEPACSDRAREAGRGLRYRDFLIVVLIARGEPSFKDNWIYIQDPGVTVGRVQNFKSWSAELVPAGYCSYGCEYFCHESDSLWNGSDSELIERAKRELDSIGLVRRAEVIDACVVRQPKAYPVYDFDYARHVATLRAELEARYPGLHVVGRNGMHKYNNQDHSMMTAMLSVKNILAGRTVYDVWRVNQDAQYHEAGTAGVDFTDYGGRSVPQPLDSSATAEATQAKRETQARPATAALHAEPKVSANARSWRVRPSYPPARGVVLSPVGARSDAAPTRSASVKVGGSGSVLTRPSWPPQAD